MRVCDDGAFLLPREEKGEKERGAIERAQTCIESTYNLQS